jgi:predicted solute-binding protein
VQGLQSDSFDAILIAPSFIPLEPRFRLIPGMGVFCDGPSQTLRVLARCERQSIRRICATADLLPLAQIAGVLLREEGQTVEIADAPATDLADAIVVSGSEKAGQFPVLIDVDLGEWWNTATGLPLPLAVWVGRRAWSDLRRVLFRAAQTGSGADTVSSPLRYAMGVDEMDALRHHAELLHRHGFIESSLLPPLC